MTQQPQWQSGEEHPLVQRLENLKGQLQQELDKAVSDAEQQLEGLKSMLQTHAAKQEIADHG